jgi:hypothetical protein
MRRKPDKRIAIAWSYFMAGLACLCLDLAIEGEYIPLVLGIGATCLAASIIALMIISRLIFVIRTKGTDGKS